MLFGFLGSVVRENASYILASTYSLSDSSFRLRNTLCLVLSPRFIPQPFRNSMAIFRNQHQPSLATKLERILGAMSGRKEGTSGDRGAYQCLAHHFRSSPWNYEHFDRVMCRSAEVVRGVQVGCCDGFGGSATDDVRRE
jgi:hypothetical protein